MLNSYPFTRTCILLDGLATSRDNYGNDVASWTQTVVTGSIWWPSSTTEAEPVGATTTTTRYGLLIPEATAHGSGRAPSSIDRVILSDLPGQWQIDGDPRSHRSPITGSQGGLLCWLVRVTG